MENEDVLIGIISISGKPIYAESTYKGPYVITPHPWNDQILDTDLKMMTEDMTVKKIPHSSVDNIYGGRTVTIGGH